MLLTDFSKIRMGTEDISKIYQGDVQVWPKDEAKTVISFTLVSGDTWDNKAISAYTADGTLIEPSIKDTTGWTYDGEVGYFMSATDEKTEQNILSFNGINKETVFKNQTRLFDLARSMTSADLSMVKPTGNNYGRMFRDCQKLASADLSGWDMTDATSTLNMFINCYAITDINMGSTFGKNGKITEMQGMFAYCKALSDLDLSGMDVTSCTNMKNLFTGCEALTSLDLSGWEVQNAKSSDAVFSLCNSLKTVRMIGSSAESIAIVKSWLSSARLSNVTVVETAGFTVSGTSTGSQITYSANGTNLTSPVANGQFSIQCDETVTSFQINSGSDDTYITSVAVMGDTSHLTTGNKMFAHLTKCTTFNLKGMDTSNMTNMNAMFNYCSNVTTLDLSNFNTSKLSNIRFMFGSASKLKNIDCSNWNLSALNYDAKINGVTYKNYFVTSAFDDCNALSSITMKNADANTINKMKTALVLSNKDDVTINS